MIQFENFYCLNSTIKVEVNGGWTAKQDSAISGTIIHKATINNDLLLCDIPQTGRILQIVNSIYENYKMLQSYYKAIS